MLTGDGAALACPATAVGAPKLVTRKVRRLLYRGRSWAGRPLTAKGKPVLAWIDRLPPDMVT